LVDVDFPLDVKLFHNLINDARSIYKNMNQSKISEPL
jgi:hypothetical protein